MAKTTFFKSAAPKPSNRTGDKKNNFSKPGTSSRQRINGSIFAKELRVVDDAGQQLGIMTRDEALKLAEQQEKDLVEIAPQANPPVCKIIDFGKFQYEQQKREKTQKKQQQSQQMKEVRFKWRTDTHDFDFKVRHAREFIEEGSKVKASVYFRGREITHQDIGRELLQRFIAAMIDIAKVDQQVQAEGRTCSVVIAPDKTKKKKKVQTLKEPKEASEPASETSSEQKI